MNEDKLNIQLRKFLKEVGVTSQRAIETAVHEAQEAHRLPASQKVRATMTLSIPGLDLRHEVVGEIEFD